MKIIFETEDEQEAKRLAKANDMAAALWEIVHNVWREFKYSDYDYHPAWDKIRDVLDDHGINIDDLVK